MNEYMERLMGKMCGRAVDSLRELLRNPSTPISAKVQLINMILDRTMGKPEETMRLLTAQENIEAAEERIAEIIRQIKMRKGNDNEKGL